MRPGWLFAAFAWWACGAMPQPAVLGRAPFDSALRPLQPLIDAAPEGSTLRLPPGRWAGPVTISKPLTLDGQHAATLDGKGVGTVVHVTGRSVTLRRLRVTGSGSSHDGMDSAIVLEGEGHRVEHVTLDDVLFGVFLRAAKGSTVCGSVISSKAEEHSLRGDGVRIWNGQDNRIIGNDVFDARDVGLANTWRNEVKHNRIRRGRYGLQLVFSPHNVLEDNVLDGNLTGIAIMYSNGVELRRNHVLHSRGVSGVGLSFKESGAAIVEDNHVVHCAVGAKTNAPTTPEALITFRGNTFAHNVAGMDFYGESGGHQIVDNRFEKNLVHVTVSAPMSARGQHWDGNVWDDYEGFDRDGDGVGDTPHEVYAFADRIWQETPQATFFRNAPALELLDFLERLAPFAGPELTLRDLHPVVRGPSAPEALPAFTPTCP